MARFQEVPGQSDGSGPASRGLAISDYAHPSGSLTAGENPVSSPSHSTKERLAGAAWEAAGPARDSNIKGDLAPAAGILLAAILSIPFWCLLGLGLWWAFKG